MKTTQQQRDKWRAEIARGVVPYRIAEAQLCLLDDADRCAELEADSDIVTKGDLEALLGKLKEMKSKDLAVIARYAHKPPNDEYHLHRGVVHGLNTAIIAIQDMVGDGEEGS